MWTVISQNETYSGLTFKEKEEIIHRLKEKQEAFHVIDPDKYKMYYEPPKP
jgi:hypothetical protein